MATLTRHTESFRAALIKVVRAAFPENVVPMVQAYEGKVDAKSIIAHTFRTPAILITILGGKTGTYGGTAYDNLVCGAFILTKDQLEDKRTAMALLLRERLAVTIRRASITFSSIHKFGGIGKNDPEIQWENRFDRELDEMGLTLWLGAWKHGIEIPAIEDYDNLADFATTWVEIFGPGDVETTVETGKADTEQQIDLETL